ncbi:SMC5-SMC6 complex component Non-SMC element 1 [Brevipalpus obovatus]|uniref:SMC5-SMC6 complex component Non-SMC element 1 n=1 Tax=Brevipalpus obovatus TaxID=246614 RepID=UPI003D9E9009
MEDITLEEDHQALLQLFMKVKAATCQEIFDWGAKLELINGWGDLEDKIVTINRVIRVFRQQIQKCTDEETEQDHYVFFNMSDNEIARLAILFTKPQLEFFKKLIEKIVLSSSGYVYKDDVVETCRTELEELNVKIGLTEAFELIQKWIDFKYFSDNSSGKRICLGVSSLTELSPYLKQYYPHNVTSCELCKFICLQGVDCHHLSVKLHNRCAIKYFDSFKNCSTCRDNVK